MEFPSHYADLTGYGEKGPDANLPGFDITAYWSRSGLLSLDTRCWQSPPHYRSRAPETAQRPLELFVAIVTGLYRRERTGKGSYVTTSLLAEGVWSASIAIQPALCEAKFSPQHDRKNPANAGTEYIQEFR